MKNLGIAMIVLGVATGGVALFMETSVGTSIPDMSLYALTGSVGTRYEQVVNLEKLQAQSMVFMAGCAILVVGAIFTAAGELAERLGQGTRQFSEVPSPAKEHSIVPVQKPLQFVEPELSEEELEERRRTERNLTIGVLAFIALLVAVAFAASQLPSSEETVLNNVTQSTRDIEGADLPKNPVSKAPRR